MMRSMFAGVSGLKAHQVRMDIIGNNIANVNSAGYKSSRATFQDMLSQTLRAATAPTEAKGGTNPQQIGLGVQLGSIDVKHTQGNTQSTGYITDLAIEGDGFFVLGHGANRLYTRAGMFGLDNGTEGNLVSLVNGQRVLGYKADDDGYIDPNSSLESMYISASETITPRATTNVTFAGNLDNRLPANHVVDRTVQVFDSRGREHTIIVNFGRLEGADPLNPGNFRNAWEWDANWFMVSDAIQSHQNMITNNERYIVYDNSGLEMRNSSGTVVATSTDGRMWVSKLVSGEEGPAFEFEASLQPGATVNATADQGYLFLTSEVSLTKNYSSSGLTLTTDPLPNATNTRLSAHTTYFVEEGTAPGTFELLDNSGLVVATSDDGDGRIWQILDNDGNPSGEFFEFVSALNAGAKVTTGDDIEALALTAYNFDPTGSITAVDREIHFNPDGSFAGVAENQVTLNPALAYDVELTLDFSDFTMYADTFTGKFISQNGYTSGALESYAIDQNGVIVGSFSNGLTRALGQVALARFANPAGLQRAGSTMFVDTPNSGTAQIGAAGIPGFGQISPSSLEMSNVDLSEEFTDMIITQRGFQANSRIITTSDEMLQELVNLKR